MVAIRVDAVIVSKEGKDVGVENLFSPATSLDESSGDVSVVELGNLFIVEEERSLDGCKVDRVDQLVVNILQESPLQTILLGVVDDPFMQAFGTSVIDFAVVESKDGIEFYSLLEHVKIGALDGDVCVDLLNVIKVVQNLLLPGAQDTETDHLKVSSSPRAVGAGRFHALDARAGEVSLSQKRQIGKLLIGEVRSHRHPMNDCRVLEPQFNLIANLANVIKGQKGGIVSFTDLR